MVLPFTSGIEVGKLTGNVPHHDRTRQHTDYLPLGEFEVEAPASRLISSWTESRNQFPLRARSLAERPRTN